MLRIKERGVCVRSETRAFSLSDIAKLQNNFCGY
jgi:hypothetical protein